MYQIRKIHTLKSVLGLDDDLYRDMLMSFGVQTSKDLTYTEGRILIEILEDKAVVLNLWIKKQQKYSELQRDHKMATNAQLRTIEGLWNSLSKYDPEKYNLKTLRHFLQSKHKTDDIIFLTKNRAVKVIQSILRIKENLEKSVATL